MTNNELIETVKETHRQSLQKPKPAWPAGVRRALAFIIAHLYDPLLSVSLMKEQCRISNHNFSATFNHHLKRRPKRYIEYHRIAVAKKMFVHPQLSHIAISTVAFEIGFAAVSAFSKSIKRETGLSPSRWRNKHGNR